MHAALALALALVGCDGTGAGARPDAAADPPVDAAPDATVDASADAARASFVEQVRDVMPPILGGALTEGQCTYPDGSRGLLGSYRLVDDCVVCQCTTYGMRCARRTGCPRAVCVLVDGTELARGATATIDCIDCACGDDGATCTRSTAGDCPSDACVLRDGTLVPLGEQRFVSECHACDCDATSGLSCTNLCHPTCEPAGVPDQERVLGADGCSTCVCDYSDLACESSGC